jgi:putative FmdB family regulatory protein
MPTYEYECERCERSYEVEQKMSDPPLAICETDGCDAKPRRMIARNTGFVLKGGGWFKDGY